MYEPNPFKNKFLENLPLALTPQQRVAFEAINISLNIIELKYRQIEARLDLYETPEKVFKMPFQERVLIFSDIWGLIDQAHAVNRLLFQSSKKGGKEKMFDFSVNLEGSEITKKIQKHYDTYFEILSFLRNRMDHLPDNLQSSANKKSLESPLYGTLAYALTNAEEIKEQKLVRVVLLTCSPFFKEKHSYDAINSCNYTTYLHPTDHFQLSAFGRKINLSELYDSIQEIKNTFNIDMGKIFQSTLEKYADDKGIDRQEIYTTLPGEVVSIFEGFLASEEEAEKLGFIQKISD